MRQKYNFSLTNKQQYQKHLIEKQKLAFEINDQIYMGLYSSIFLKIDMGMSLGEYKAKDGKIYSTVDPYLRISGDEKEK